MKSFILLVVLSIFIFAIACSSKAIMKHQRNVNQQSQSENAFKELSQETK